MELLKEITDIIVSIKNANFAYRNGTPCISDTEYDNLVDSLRDTIGEDEFSKFRETLTECGGNVKHPFKMGSLDKIKAFDEKASIKNWIYNHIPENGDGSEGIFVSSKIDGCSARLTYHNGILIAASTRGDGYTGVDILRKVSLFAPTNISKNFSGDIRGEITLTRETLEALSSLNGKTYKNLRNATVGLVNSKDSSDDEISFLRFFPYEIMGNTGMSKKRQFEKLKSLGFTTALHKEFTDIYNDVFSKDGEYDNALMSIYNSFIEEAPFDIDGLVVSDLYDDDIFENEFIPLKTVAVKFNQMTGTSTLIDIQWNLAKSGKLRPIGIIDAVILGGTSITAVTLNNIRYIKELGLSYGCSVDVLKSGDIIPKIVGVSHPHNERESAIEYPTVCPSCGHKLNYSIDQLYPTCTNPNCDDMLANKILHLLRQLEIKHVSLKTIKKFGILHISDILSLKKDGSSIKNTFLKELNDKFFGADKVTLLEAFDYDGVSSKIIDKMIGHYGYDTIVNADRDELIKNLPIGVGEKFIDKFIDGWNKCKNDYFSIISDSRYHGQNVTKSKPASISGILNGFGFVVTGELKSMGRNQFKDIVNENGGVYQSSISKKTSYLVTNDQTTGTTKIKKARDLGVKIINENEFLNMIQHGTEDSNFSIF